jgi:amino acid transporter
MIKAFLYVTWGMTIVGIAFAWAFDRVIPTKFADVNDRFHTPHVAIGSLTGLAVIMLILYAFTSWPTVMTIGIVLWSVAYAIPGLAATAFPYVMKETFDQAPAFLRKKLAGVPVLAVLGALCAISFAYIGYVAATDSLISTLTAVGAGIAVAIIAFGFAVYFISATTINEQA